MITSVKYVASVSYCCNCAIISKCNDATQIQVQGRLPLLPCRVSVKDILDQFRSHFDAELELPEHWRLKEVPNR